MSKRLTALMVVTGLLVTGHSWAASAGMQSIRTVLQNSRILSVEQAHYIEAETERVRVIPVTVRVGPSEGLDHAVRIFVANHPKAPLRKGGTICGSGRVIPVLLIVDNAFGPPEGFELHPLAIVVDRVVPCR